MQRIVKKKNKKMPDITEFLKNMNSVDPNSSDVSNSEIILRQYISYRKLFTQFKMDLCKIYKILRSKSINLNGLSGILLNVDKLQKAHFNIDTSEIEKLIDIRAADAGRLIDIKLAHNKVENSNLMATAAKIGANIARSKINKMDLHKFSYKCNTNLTSLIIFDGIATENVVSKRDVNFTQITNLKDIFDQSIPDITDIREPIYNLILDVYSVCKELNLLRKEPNFDVDKFFDALSGMLDKIGTGFGNEYSDVLGLISKSKQLFKDNFRVYYKQFMNTGDGTVLITNFLEDLLSKKIIDIEVGGSNSNKLSVLMQLKKFINKIKTTLVATMKKKNATRPKVIDNLLDYVDDIFEKMEKNDSDEPDDEENIELMEKFQEQFTNMTNIIK